MLVSRMSGGHLPWIQGNNIYLAGYCPALRYQNSRVSNLKIQHLVSGHLGFQTFGLGLNIKPLAFLILQLSDFNKVIVLVSQDHQTLDDLLPVLSL